MISLLQQAVKEDIFILLQHDDSARSIWEALRTKFEGSTEMIKNKKSLLKKEFDLFSSLAGETTEILIERYCHLVRSMSRLDITKDREEWVEKLADALPQKEWSTYLMILKNTGEYDRLTIAQFIEKLEGQDLEQQKIARMNNSSGQQDIKIYFKGNVQNVEASPKIQTAFSAENSSGSLNQSSINNSGFSSYPSVNPNVSTSNHQFQSSNNGNGHVLQCNIALHLQNGQNFSKEVAKGHMALLVTVLESYESLVEGRIGNPMLTKEDYDQIDAEELELMDIKWCLASVEKRHFKRECINREACGAQNPFGNNDYHQKAFYHQVSQQPSSSSANSIEDGKKKAYLVNQEDERLPEGFSWDKYIPAESNSKFRAFIAQIIQEPQLMKEWMDVFADDEKSQDGESVSSEDDKLELKKRRAAKEKKEVKCENVVQVEEKNEQSKEVKVIEKTVEVTKPYLKCLEPCKHCEEKDKKYSELEEMKEKLLFNVKYVKKSYDVLNRTVNQLEKTNSEREVALTMMNAVMMSKQKAINHYIEECAELKQELETEKIENERIRRLLMDYLSSDYLIDRIYPTVAGFEAFQDKKSEDTDTGKKQSVNHNKFPPPIWEGYSPS
ncbi:hypothetical protein HanXRQr2_Chr03g0101521 [Helianthus annuus]|uniref:Uncharacterized protein n=1 Tax=Helianthus annuus TaxID=4232 RepID=A0A9K3JFG9_HELAN|nr:hypothetical protein HanXRQr2_Chr03g0101521 [Helianthus annuus]